MAPHGCKQVAPCSALPPDRYSSAPPHPERPPQTPTHAPRDPRSHSAKSYRSTTPSAASKNSAPLYTQSASATPHARQSPCPSTPRPTHPQSPPARECRHPPVPPLQSDPDLAKYRYRSKTKAAHADPANLCRWWHSAKPESAPPAHLFRRENQDRNLRGPS